jgi:hypothetical protein
MAGFHQACLFHVQNMHPTCGTPVVLGASYKAMQAHMCTSAGLPAQSRLVPAVNATLLHCVHWLAHQRLDQQLQALGEAPHDPDALKAWTREHERLENVVSCYDAPTLLGEHKGRVDSTAPTWKVHHPGVRVSSLVFFNTVNAGGGAQAVSSSSLAVDGAGLAFPSR